VESFGAARHSRRRRRSSSPPSSGSLQDSVDSLSAARLGQTGPEGVDTPGLSAYGSEQRPPAKRRRLAESNMRSDENCVHTTSNGFATIPNGSNAKKTTLSGSANGHFTSQPTSTSAAPSQANGSVRSPSPVRPPLYHGHSREEVTRILIQGLHDLGYNDAAVCLSRESHFELESPSVASFRQAILAGQWTDAEAILLGTHLNGNERVSGQPNLISDGPAGLVLAEGADKSQMLDAAAKVP
jgi:WD repeat-containing protein 26